MTQRDSKADDGSGSLMPSWALDVLLLAVIAVLIVVQFTGGG